MLSIMSELKLKIGLSKSQADMAPEYKALHGFNR